MSVCGECKGKVERNDNNKVECVQCKCLFHASCVKINSTDLDFLKKQNAQWKCPSCEILNRKLRINNSPPLSPRNLSISCNSQQNLIQSPLSNNPKIILNNENIPLSDVMLKKLNKIEIQNSFLSDSLNKLNLEISNILSSVEIVHNTMKLLQENILENNNKLIELQAEIHTNKINFETNLSECNKRIEFLERQHVKNNIEICGVPYTKNEKVRDIVQKIIKISLDLNIDDRSIDHCFRKKGKKNSTNENKSDATNDNDLPIVVRFFSFDVKSLVMNKKYELKPNIKSATIVPNTSNDIYINDYLTFTTKKIYYEAKKIKEEMKYKHLWIRNNNVMLRYSDGEDIIYLKTISDVQKILNSK